MADEQKLGVAGEFDSEAFNKGLEKYIASLLKAEKTTDKVVEHLNRLGASLDKIIGSSAGLDKAAKEMDQFKNSLGAISKSIPDVKPLNKFFSDVAKGATVLKPIASEIRALASLNRSIVALSQSAPVPASVIDSLRQLEPVVRELGSVPNFIPVARSISGISIALERLANIGDKPKAALDTLTSLGVRLKTIAGNSTEIRKVSNAISLVARAMQGLSGIKSIPANALASLGAIANTLRAISQISGVKDAANQLSLVSRALSRLSGIKSIPTQSIASISAIANVLRSISQISGVSNAAKALQNVGLALNRMGRIQAIPAKAIASIAAIANALRSVSNIGNIPGTVKALGSLSTALTKLSKVQPVPPHVFQNLRALVQSLGGIGTGGNIQALIGVTNALTQALQRLSSAQAQAVPQMERFRTSFTQGLAVGVGVQAVAMFRDLASAIGRFAAQTIGTITFFERFDLTLKAVLAREIQTRDATISQAEALEQAIKPAQGYFRVLEQIAIQSIFSPEDVALSFRLATAFGFTANQALRLTQAIVDFTSFAGLGNEALERISRSLAQVRNRGKLTADNVRELAEAGVPVYDILGKAFDKTTAELLELQEDGAIPAGQAITAIVEHFEQYAGAAERATNTTTGLIGKIREIRVLAARDIFGEIFKSLQPALKEITDFVTSNEFRATLVALGQTIGSNLAKALQSLRNSFTSLISAFNNLSPKTKDFIKTFVLVGAIVVSVIGAIGALGIVIPALINPFTVVTIAISGLATLWINNFNRIQSVTTSAVSNISRLFDSLARSATNWGINIVRSLAAGVAGATNLIVQALSTISRVFTFFLKPGSPPKILPDLDIWGAEAADVYLSGWTKADFDELNKFGQALSNQIRNLVGIGNIDELSAPRRIIGTRQALSQALQDIKTFGAVTEQTLQRIFNATLINRNLLKSYFDSYAELTRATTALKEAQDALNATMKAYDEQLKPLQDRLRDIQDAQENAEEQKQVARLQRIIANRGATDSRRTSALLELEQIQVENQIEALEREKDAAQESGQTVVNELEKALEQSRENLAIAEARINEQLEINSLLAEEARIRKQIEDELARQKDPRILALEKQIEAFTIQQEFLGNLIDLAHQQFILTDKDATAAQKKTAELRIQELLLDNQIKAIEAAKLGVNLDPLTQVPIVPADFMNIKELEESLGSLGEEFEGISNLDLETPIVEFKDALKEAKRTVADFGTSISTTLQKINDALPPFLRFKKTTEELNLENIDLSLPPSMQISDQIEGETESINGFRSALLILGTALGGSRILRILGSIGKGLLGFGAKANIITLVLSTLAVAWFENWFGIQEITFGAIDKIQEKFKEFTNSPFFRGIVKNLNNLGKKITGFFSLLTTPQGRVQVFEFVKEAIADALLAIADFIILTPEELFRGLAALTNFGGEFVAGLIRGFGEAFGGFIEFIIGTVIPNVLLAIGGIFKAIFIELPKFFVNLATELFNNRGNLWQWILDSVGETIAAFQEWLLSIENGLLVDIIPAIKDAGGSIMQGFLDGINELLTKLGLPTLDEIWQKIIDNVLTFFGITEGTSSEMADQVGDPTGKGFFQGIKDALTEGLPDLDLSFQDLFKDLTGSENLNTLVYDLSLSLGQGLVDGIIAGLWSKYTEATTAVTDFFGGLFGAGEKEIEAGSPSERADRELGAPIGEGVTQGLENALSQTRLQQILEDALSVFDQIRSKGILAGTELQEGFSSSMDLLKEETTKQINTTRANFIADVMAIKNAVVTNSQLLKADFIKNIGLMRTEGGKSVTGFKTDTNRTFNDLQRILVSETGIIPTITGKVVEFFTDMSTEVNEIVGDMILLLVDQLAGEEGLTTQLETLFVAKGVILGESFGTGIAQGITNKLEPIKTAALTVIQGALQAALVAINALQQPTPSSVGASSVDTFNNRIGSTGGGSDNIPVVGGASITKIYNLNVNSAQSSRGIIRDFGIMEVMGA